MVEAQLVLAIPGEAADTRKFNSLRHCVSLRRRTDAPLPGRMVKRDGSVGQTGGHVGSSPVLTRPRQLT
jgi:hypothetical protein